MTAYLLKCGHSLDGHGQVELPIPARARPAHLPGPDDTLFVWSHAEGLIGEARLRATTADRMHLHPMTQYAEPLPPSWLDGADREKATIRSKIHCDRHDRLWRLDIDEIAELDTARRSKRGD